jgi:hypothetical protein
VGRDCRNFFLINAASCDSDAGVSLKEPKACTERASCCIYMGGRFVLPVAWARKGEVPTRDLDHV